MLYPLMLVCVIKPLNWNTGNHSHQARFFFSTTCYQEKEANYSEA